MLPPALDLPLHQAFGWIKHDLLHASLLPRLSNHEPKSRIIFWRFFELESQSKPSNLSAPRPFSGTPDDAMAHEVGSWWQSWGRWARARALYCRRLLGGGGAALGLDAETTDPKGFSFLSPPSKTLRVFVRILFAAGSYDRFPKCPPWLTWDLSRVLEDLIRVEKLPRLHSRVEVSLFQAPFGLVSSSMKFDIHGLPSLFRHWHWEAVTGLQMGLRARVFTFSRRPS